MCQQQVDLAAANAKEADCVEEASYAAPTPLRRRRPSEAFSVQEATLRDAEALQQLFQQGYVCCHRELHIGQACGSAKLEEWEAALGAVDFMEVLSPASPSAPKGKKKAKKASAAEKTVRLLICTELLAGSNASPAGYVLYELREKGPRSARQKYTELVNIVVHDRFRGRGAGRVLFQAMQKELAESAPEFASDIRLYVDEQNAGPLTWYRRLGFQDSGYQSETIGGEKVTFVRLALKEAA